MATKAKIRTNLDDYTEDEFYKAAVLIFNFLTLNVADFTGLPITMIVFDPLIVTFNTTRTAIYYAAKAADVAAARTAVQTVITKNGNWINTFTNGNLTLLKKCGYPMAKERESQGQLDATILTLTVLKEAGCLEFLISHVDGLGLKYAIMYTPVSNPDNNPANWKFYYAAQRDGIIDGLESKVDYKFVSFAMGTDKRITYSDPVIMSAQ